MSGLLKMLKTQNKVNIVARGEDWADQNLDWRLAIMLEGSELIDSFPWKWWKAGHADIENARVEIVDIIHFTLSMMIEEKIVIDDAYEAKLTALTLTDTAKLPDDQKALLIYLKNIIKVASNNGSAVEIADVVFLAAGKIGMTFEEIKKLYFGKAVLNHFRQENGYAKGTYHKIWNNEEDNVVMAELANTLTYSDSFDQDLHTMLTERYMMVQ